MRKVFGGAALLLVVVAIGVVAWAVPEMQRRAPSTERAEAAMLQPSPEPPKPAAMNSPRLHSTEPSDGLWIEGLEDAYRGRGWLHQAAFRYRGRYLDCWLTYEIGGRRRETSITEHELASVLLRENAHPEMSRSVPTGQIDILIAYVGGECRIEHACSRSFGTGGFTSQIINPREPFPMWWRGTSSTRALRSGRLSCTPGQEYNLYGHSMTTLHEIPEGFLRFHAHLGEEFRRGGEKRVFDGYRVFPQSTDGSSGAFWKSRDETIRLPAALTAGLMTGAAGRGIAPVSVGLPYEAFQERYLCGAIVRLEARFLTDSEAQRVKDKAKELAESGRVAPSSLDLVPLIRTFRGTRRD